MDSTEISKIIERKNERIKDRMADDASNLIDGILKNNERIAALQKENDEYRKALKELNVDVVDAKTILGE